MIYHSFVPADFTYYIAAQQHIHVTYVIVVYNTVIGFIESA